MQQWKEIGLMQICQEVGNQKPTLANTSMKHKAPSDKRLMIYKQRAIKSELSRKQQ